MSSTLQKSCLAAGFASIGIGVLTAWSSPATGYELSIYGGTPTTFWVAVLAALVASVPIVFALGDQRGLALGGVAFSSIVSLPLIRGYHYLGEGDSLTHLGYARDLSEGAGSAQDITYPVVHTLGAVVHEVTGLGLARSLLVVLATFVIAFVVFVPLAVRSIDPDPTIVAVGGFSGLLLLPINHVSGHMQIHPTSQAVMFAPIVVFLFVLTLARDDRRFVALFYLVGIAFVLLHPQQAANFVVFFGAVAAAQLAHWAASGRKTGHVRRPVFSLVAAFGILFWLWAHNLRAFEGTLEIFARSLVEDSQAAESVASRSVSLAAVGGGIGEVFFKLFFVSAAYCVLAGSLLTTAVLESFGRLPDRFPFTVFERVVDTERTLLAYFSVGFVPVGVLFLALLGGGVSDQYFRYLAFIMVLVTVLGAIALGHLLRWLGDAFGSRRSRAIACALVVGFLLLTVPIVFGSPYFYQTSDHVTEAQMTGYETAFERGDPQIPYENVRSPSERYGHAINGVVAEEQREDDQRVRGNAVPDHFADQSLHEFYDEPVYVAITGADRERDPELYRGFRFDHDDFAYLDRDPHLNKVQSNREFDLYLVTPP